MVNVCSTNTWLKPAIAAIELCQMVVQGQWNEDSRLLQLPHFDKDRAAAFDGEGVSSIFDFLDMERSFNLVVSLVDIRHDPSKLDHQMIEFLQEGGYPFVVALTKADKLSRSQQGRQLATIRKQLSVPAEDIIVTSSQTGFGIDELKRRIEAACLEPEDAESAEDGAGAADTDGLPA